ncbi:MAG: hypothetical protein IKI31_05275, partial [Treponema sp.]|nr:hypothetical protein [Treponema sp.]
NFEIEFFDFDEEILFTTAAPSFSAGFVTHFFIIKGFYASASVDYMLVLNQNNMLGFLIPSIGLGYKL